MRRLLRCATVVTNILLCAAREKGVAMKRFTTEGTNDQERLGLIPAQRRAEEEEPLNLSFEGGVAGARTLSRRQALGLLGGSLAGFTLLSSELAAPAKATVGGIEYNDIITLKCLGDKPGPRYLDGRTHNGTVGLAPHTNPPYTGTKWRVNYVSDYFNYIALHCEGTGPGDARWLDGRTQDRTVGLAPNTNPPYTGTKWHLTTNIRNQPNPDFAGYFLYCEGTGPGDARYLDGRTDAGDVVLSPTTNNPFTGTRWWIDVVQAAR
jgi:hypothetical protein